MGEKPQQLKGKGGSKKGYSNIVVSIKNRKRCHPRCPIFDVCPMMPLSMSRANVESSCLLNKGGNVLIRRFINLMVKGEDGLLSEINNTLYSYAHDIEVAPPSVKRDYALMCLKLHDQLYCKKQVEQQERPSLTVVINEMGSDGKLREIVPIVDVSPIHLQGGKTQKLRDAVGECKKDDPESLLNSPAVINEIFGREVLVQDERTEGVNVQKQDNRTEDDESSGTESEPEELAEPPESTE